MRIEVVVSAGGHDHGIVARADLQIDSGILAEVIVVARQQLPCCAVLSIQAQGAVEQAYFEKSLGKRLGSQCALGGNEKPNHIQVIGFGTVEVTPMHKIMVTRLDGFGRSDDCKCRVVVHDRQRRQLVRVAKTQKMANFMHCGFEPADAIRIDRLAVSVIPELGVVHDRDRLTRFGMVASESQYTTGPDTNLGIEDANVSRNDCQSRDRRFVKLHSEIVCVQIEDLSRAVLLL